MSEKWSLMNQKELVKKEKTLKNTIENTIVDSILRRKKNKKYDLVKAD